MGNSILMPIKKEFLDVFETFMNEEQKDKIRANYVRQYIEGIIDLLLKQKIIQHLKPNENYEGVNWGRKIKILKENYDENISNKIQNILKVGGDGSHFNGNVLEEDLDEIIKDAIHIVEDIFVKYFVDPQHRFGTEDIFTIFSMLPLENRIYILENVYNYYSDWAVIDRLTLAYTKNGNIKKAIDFLDSAKKDGIIDSDIAIIQKTKLEMLYDNLPELHRLNEVNDDYNCIAISAAPDVYVVGFPSSKDIFDTECAVRHFKDWFEKRKEKYPEFINLFFCLMSYDDRIYK